MKSQDFLNPIKAFETRHNVSNASIRALASRKLSGLSDDRAWDIYLAVRRAADEGSQLAMLLCAIWPEGHRGPAQTEVERYRWVERAGEYPPALFELARRLEKGVGVQRNLKKALEFYERSAAGGFGLAAHRLGSAHMDGDLGTVDAPKALGYMEQAYHDGESLGALTLAQWFESGRQVIRNIPAAVRWYQKASEMGNFFATHRLQMAYTLGELGLPRDPELVKRYQSAFNAQTDITVEDESRDSNPSQP